MCWVARLIRRTQTGHHASARRASHRRRREGAHNTTVPLIYAMSTLLTIVSIGLTFLAIELAFGGGRDGK